MVTKILSTAIGLLVLFEFGQAIPKNQFFGMHGTFLEVVDDSFTGPVRLQRDFKFFNATHRTLYVSNNGAVSFLKGIRSFTPDCGPLDTQSKMIAPFWGDVDIRRGGHIKFRESTSREDINHANRQLERSFPDYPNLRMDWTFTATWEEVPFYNGKTALTDTIGVCLNDNARNTFQLTLTTDGIHSFAIFYYDKLEWMAGMASGGNCSGLGGQPAKAGFDVGDGAHFYPIQDSCTLNVRNIAKNSNVNEIGVWIWRIDGGLEAPPKPVPTTQAPSTTPEPQTQPPTTQEPQTQPPTTQQAITTPQPTTEAPTTTQAPTTQLPTTTQAPFTPPPPTSRPDPNSQCPPQRPTTPCRESLVNIIEHVINFYNTFPALCLGKDCNSLGPNVPTAEPITQAPTTAPPTESSSTTPTESPSTTPTDAPTTTAEVTTETLTSTTAQSIQPPACTIDNDLAILLDSSGSIGANNYAIAKDFVANLSHAFTEHPGNRLLFIDYSNAAVIRIPFEPRQTPVQIEAKIRATTWQRRMTYTGKAIDLARTQFAANRRAVAQNLILLTDGASTDSAIPKAVSARQDGITIFTVGMGTGINRDELLRIAGNETRRHIVDTFDGLRTILLDITRELCPPPAASTTPGRSTAT